MGIMNTEALQENWRFCCENEQPRKLEPLA